MGPSRAQAGVSQETATPPAWMASSLSYGIRVGAGLGPRRRRLRRMRRLRDRGSAHPSAATGAPPAVSRIPYQNPQVPSALQMKGEKHVPHDPKQPSDPHSLSEQSGVQKNVQEPATQTDRTPHWPQLPPQPSPPHSFPVQQDRQRCFLRRLRRFFLASTPLNWSRGAIGAIDPMPAMRSKVPRRRRVAWPERARARLSNWPRSKMLLPFNW
jgi:hypothetical protein